MDAKVPTSHLIDRCMRLRLDQLVQLLLDRSSNGASLAAVDLAVLRISVL